MYRVCVPSKNAILPYSEYFFTISIVTAKMTSCLRERYLRASLLRFQANLVIHDKAVRQSSKFNFTPMQWLIKYWEKGRIAFFFFGGGGTPCRRLVSTLLYSHSSYTPNLSYRHPSPHDLPFVSVIFDLPAFTLSRIDTENVLCCFI